MIYYEKGIILVVAAMKPGVYHLKMKTILWIMDRNSQEEEEEEEEVEVDDDGAGAGVEVVEGLEEIHGEGDKINRKPGFLITRKCQYCNILYSSCI